MWCNFSQEEARSRHGIHGLSFRIYLQHFTSCPTQQLRTQEDIMNIIENFVVHWYERTSVLTKVNAARQRLFSKKSITLENIPPAEAALLEHTKIATYTAGYVWGQVLLKNLLLQVQENGTEFKTMDGNHFGHHCHRMRNIAMNSFSALVVYKGQSQLYCNMWMWWKLLQWLNWNINIGDLTIKWSRPYIYTSQSSRVVQTKLGNTSKTVMISVFKIDEYILTHL